MANGMKSRQALKRVPTLIEQHEARKASDARWAKVDKWINKGCLIVTVIGVAVIALRGLLKW